LSAPSLAFPEVPSSTGTVFVVAALSLSLSTNQQQLPLWNGGQTMECFPRAFNI